MATVITQTAPAAATAARKPFYRTLWGQVLLGVAIAIVVGYVSPATGVAMRPLGDAFIRLITMVISLVIFCTVAAGIAGMDSIKKVGRVGGKALLYFEVLTSIALIIGLVVELSPVFGMPGDFKYATALLILILLLLVRPQGLLGKPQRIG